MKWLTNFSPKSLKVLMDLGGNEENQDLTAFFKVVGKALHIMALSAPCMDMLVWNISRWSMGWAIPSYDSIVGSLKPLGGTVSSTSWVKRELPSVSKFTYAPPIVTYFSIASILAYMSSHFLSFFTSSLCLVSISLKFTSLLPSSSWSHLLIARISLIASNLRLRSVVDLNSLISWVFSSYLGRTLFEMRWLGIKDSSRE